MILLWNAAVILYKAGSQTGIEDRHIKFMLSTGTYSTDGFNWKVKLAVLKQRQDWDEPQIKDLKLAIPQHDIRAFLLRLVYPATILILLCMGGGDKFTPLCRIFFNNFFFHLS